MSQRCYVARLRALSSRPSCNATCNPWDRGSGPHGRASYGGSRRWLSLLLACSALATTACPEAATDDPVEQGRRVYRANCTVCHGFEPTVEGTLGPVVAGSSRELLEARVIRGEYPPGYTPKRDTAVMPALPHLQGEIDALAAYLNQPEP